MTWLQFKTYFTGESWGTPGLLDEDGPYPTKHPLEKGSGLGPLAAYFAAARQPT